MKEEGTAMSYRCETDSAIVAEKQESADPNGRCGSLSLLSLPTTKSTVSQTAEQTVGHKTREEYEIPVLLMKW